jgi:hypothetical protein
MNLVAKLGSKVALVLGAFLLISMDLHADGESNYIFESGIFKTLNFDVVKIGINTKNIVVGGSEGVEFGYIVTSLDRTDFTHFTVIKTPIPREITGSQVEGLGFKDDAVEITYPTKVCPGYCFVVVTLSESDPVGLYEFEVNINHQYARTIRFTVKGRE